MQHPKSQARRKTSSGRPNLRSPTAPEVVLCDGSGVPASAFITGELCPKSSVGIGSSDATGLTAVFGAGVLVGVTADSAGEGSGTVVVPCPVPEFVASGSGVEVTGTAVVAVVDSVVLAVVVESAMEVTVVSVPDCGGSVAAVVNVVLVVVKKVVAGAAVVGEGSTGCGE